MATKLERSAKLDNVKGFLIILMVFAHFISSLLKWGGAYNAMLFSVINAFHMAAFLLVSGYLSLNRIRNWEYGKLLTRCLLPFVFAQLGLFFLFALTNEIDLFYFTESSDQFFLFRPIGPLWYLFAVTLYIPVVIMIEAQKKPVWFSIALIILAALLMGFGHRTMYFRLNKLVCFFPFFYAGYLGAKYRFQEKWQRVWHRNGWGLVLFVLAIALLVRLYDLTHTYINWTGLVSMEDNGRYIEHIKIPSAPYWLLGPLARLLLILVAIVIGIVLIMMMPSQQTILSYLGKYSIYPYVLHWFVLRGIMILKQKQIGDGTLQTVVDFLNQGINVYVFALPGIVLLCFLLASKPVRNIFRPLFEPKWAEKGFRSLESQLKEKQQ